MPRSQTPTIGECIERHMRSKAHMAFKTVQNQRSALLRFARQVGLDRPIAYLTPSQVEIFFVERLAGQQAASVNKMRQILSNFFDYCRGHGWVRRDLLMDVKTRPVPQMDRLRIAPEPLVAMLDFHRDPRNRGYFAGTVNTGVRASEIRRMRVRDVDWNTEGIYVYRSKTHRDDWLPMTPTLRVEMRRWLRAYAKELGKPLEPNMYLFPARKPPKWLPGKDENGKQRREPYGALKPYSPLHQPEKIIQRAMMGMGHVDVKYQGVHTVRRSIARAFFDRLADQGYDNALRQTMALLGHSQQATTEHYIGLDRDRRHRDATLRDQDFLPFNQTGANVIPLRAVANED
jgi:integrase